MVDVTINLLQPIEHNGQRIASVGISRPKLDHQIRWIEQHLSTLGLLSLLSGLPETALRELSNADWGFTIAVLTALCPDPIQQDIAQGTHPFVTPAFGEVLPVEQEQAALEPAPDQRFPEPPEDATEVKRFDKPPQLKFPQAKKKGQVEPEDEGDGLGMEPQGEIAQVS